MKDDLGDRMKDFERQRTLEVLYSGEYAYARIDGRGFSKLTKGLEKPFDSAFRNTMIETTKALVKKTHAIAGYTQSDEISLAWKISDNMLFGGKVQKLTSILASMATSHFIIEGITRLPHEIIYERYPHFDARIFELPDEDELTNAFLWRYNDAYRNSIMMIAQSKFSHKKLHGKNINEAREMLAELGHFEGDYPASAVFGVFITRSTVTKDSDHGPVQRDVLVQHNFDFKSIDHSSRKNFILTGYNDK